MYVTPGDGHGNDRRRTTRAQAAVAAEAAAQGSLILRHQYFARWKLPASIALSASAFAAAGAVSRYTLRMTETRYQVAAFVIAAAGVELIVVVGRSARPSWIRFLTNAAASTLVIVLVKFHLEPVARANDVAVVRHVVRSVAHEARNVK